MNKYVLKHVRFCYIWFVVQILCTGLSFVAHYKDPVIFFIICTKNTRIKEYQNMFCLRVHTFSSALNYFWWSGTYLCVSDKVRTCMCIFMSMSLIWDFHPFQFLYQSWLLLLHLFINKIYLNSRETREIKEDWKGNYTPG